MIRRVTALRVCWSGVCGTLFMMAGAALADRARMPLMKRVPADAPGCSAAGSGVADDAAGRVLAVVHRLVVSHVLRPSLRFPRTLRSADRVRHADGRRAVP